MALSISAAAAHQLGHPVLDAPPRRRDADGNLYQPGQP